jgi:hypothetical protein
LGVAMVMLLLLRHLQRFLWYQAFSLNSDHKFWHLVESWCLWGTENRKSRIWFSDDCPQMLLWGHLVFYSTFWCLLLLPLVCSLFSVQPQHTVNCKELFIKEVLVPWITR